MISIIIPTYNRAELLKAAVMSALKQTYLDTEIIIVDDGSTDHTSKVVKQLQVDFSQKKIRYIKQAENQGAAVARNTGILAAKGEYIAFLDSDDVWMEEKLLKQMQVLQAQEEDTAMIYCEYIYHDIHGKEGISPSRELKPEIKSGNMLLPLLAIPMIGTPTMLIKKRCLLAVGMFDASLRSLEDYELSLRIAKRYKIAFLPEPLMHVYARRESVSFQVQYVLETRAKIIAAYEQELKENGLYESVKGIYLELAESVGVKDSANAYLNALLEQK